LTTQPTRNSTGEAGPTNGWWYDSSASVILAAQPNTGYAFNYWHLDGNSQGNEVNPITVNVNAPHTATAYYTQKQKQPLSVSISPLSADILLGQAVPFVSTVSGGTPPYSYQWYLDGNPVSGATIEQWAFSPTTTGLYYVNLRVTDAETTSAQSETARVNVQSVPVGGYSVSIGGTTPSVLTPYLVIVATLVVGFAMIKRALQKEE
jgi:hypothetical protein